MPFPVAVGNTWRYRLVVGPKRGIAIAKMLAVSPSSNGKQVSVRNTDIIAGQHLGRTQKYIFGSDGTITIPLGSLGGELKMSSGVRWPSASQIAAGQPATTNLTVQAGASGRSSRLVARVVVRGLGTSSVIVPAGRFRAIVVGMTLTLKAAGVREVVTTRNWMAPGIGPVKIETLLTEKGTTKVVGLESLISFKHGTAA